MMNILWDLKLSSVATMNHLNEFGVCELAPCTNSISLHKYIPKIG